MGRPQLGTKCTCTGCQERFYDLNRSPAVCPKCGAQQPPERPRAARVPPRGSFGSRMQPRQVPALAVAEDEVEPADTSDADDDEADDVDDDIDDDLEIEPGIVKPVD